MRNKNSKLIYKLEKPHWVKEAETKGLIAIKENRIYYTALNKNYDFTDPEEHVRAKLYVDLIEKYKYKESPEVIEFEKSHSIGRPKKSGAEIDILVKKDNKPFMMLETKAPDKYETEMEQSIKDQLFKVAYVEDKGGKSLRYLVYYTCFTDENEKIVEKIITIDFLKYKTYDAWIEDGRPNLMAIPKDYGIVRKPRFIKGSSHDLEIDVPREKLERIRIDLHNILWGGGKYQTELFFNLIGIFLVKIYDEKQTEDGKPYQFQIFYENGEPEAPEKVYSRINEMYKKALKKYLGYSDEEVNKVKDIVFDAPKVKYVVEVLEGISITVNKYDVLGEFFEKIVRNEFKESKGQYLTNTILVNFIIRALELDNLALDLVNEETRLPYILDPACGSGTFLIEAMKLITNHILTNKDKIKKSEAVKEFIAQMFPERRKNIWAEKFVYGVEINGDLATATKVNMVGHGDGSANIEAKDALIDFVDFTKDRLQVKKPSNIYPKSVNEQFDVIISNPPFSATIDRDTAKKLPANFMWGEKIVQSLEKQPKKMEVSSENLFIERWYQFLTPKGRLGVVLPESVFDTTENIYIRLFLYKYFWIKAVVSLPHHAFAPYTMTKTSLLFAQKKTAKEVKEYEELWERYENEYEKLKSEIEILLESEEENNSIAKKFVSLLKKLLKGNFDEKDSPLVFGELREKYSEEIKEVNKDWWVFGEVAKKIDYPIFMAHAEEIGYKRGVRSEEKRPNQLFQVDENGKIIIDTQNPKTILDHLRKIVKWD